MRASAWRRAIAEHGLVEESTRRVPYHEDVTDRRESEGYFNLTGSFQFRVVDEIPEILKD